MARVRLRRTLSGEWLHQDVPIALDLTTGLNGTNTAKGTIPAAFDVPAADGHPMWLERGTTVYVDDDNGDLEWAGLCSYSSPARSSREVEFGGVMSLYDLIPYTQIVSAWEPSIADVLHHLLNVAHADVHGTLEALLADEGLPAGFLGDEQPPDTRPVKPARDPGETRDDYQTRVFAWQEAVDDWEALYGGREPYQLSWWDHRYIGDEFRSLATGMGFDIVERHEWTAPLAPQHDLVVAALAGTLRPTLALVQGANLIGDLVPATNDGIYGNDMWVLGAGEGAAMQLGRAVAIDERVRTTRFFQAKGTETLSQLDALAHQKLTLGAASATIRSAKAREGTLPGLRPGDWLPIESDLFTGTARVSEISKSTAGGPIALTFQTGEDTDG